MIKSNWNLKLILPNENKITFEKEKARIIKEITRFIKKWKDNNDYLKDPAILKEALDEYEKLNKTTGLLGKLGYYWGLKSALNSENLKTKKTLNLLESFATQKFNELLFFSYKLSKVPLKTQKRFLKDNSLKKYHHFLEELFIEAKYLLSEKEEKIVTHLSANAYGNWVEMTQEFLNCSQERVIDDNEKLTIAPFNKILALTDHKRKDVRNYATRKVNKILSNNIKVCEKELNSVLAYKKIMDELRGYNRPDKSRHIADDIDTDIVDTLIKTVSKRNYISQRYYKLKAKLLKKRKLTYNERNIEIGDIKKTYTYSQTVEIVSKVFKRLDPEFEKYLVDFINNGQIDVYPKKGKAGGAFCAVDLPTLPTYILLNYTGKITDILTLAHEMGHGINDELMKSHVNSLNFESPKSTAEVASTFMEDFVLEELLNTVNDKEKLTILMYKLNDDISSIFRQIACYKFELDLHREYRKRGYLSSKEIGELFSNRMKEYLGTSVSMKEEFNNWWAHWSHIRQYFYVYSYASGLLISKSLQNSVRKNPQFIKDFKYFLASGTEKSPYNKFLDLGIDISKKNFWDKGLDEIERLLITCEKLAK